MSTGDGSEFQTLHEIVRAARINLSQGSWDYIVGGTETETTLKRNRRALDSVAFRPRVLRDVSRIDMSTTLLGHKLRMPVMLAPVGALYPFTEGGAVTAARAAARFGIPQLLSSVCEPGYKAVAEAAGDNLRIYQIYVRGDRAWLDNLAREVIGHGYSAICFTVDTDSYSRRERDIAKRYVKIWRSVADGFEYQASFSWDDIKSFKDTHDIPVALKGIATAEDAVIACEHGVEYVYVSNHGGRQLDHGRGALEVLPEVVAAVNGKARVLFDSGITRGSDVVKAIALGAQAVCIGRLACYGLAAAGEAGLVRVLELLEEEIRICLSLLGVTHWETLDGTYLHPAEPVDPPHVTSAFPLLDLDSDRY